MSKAVRNFLFMASLLVAGACGYNVHPDDNSSAGVDATADDPTWDERSPDFTTDRAHLQDLDRLGDTLPGDALVNDGDGDISPDRSHPEQDAPTELDRASSDLGTTDELRLDFQHDPVTTPDLGPTAPLTNVWITEIMASNDATLTDEDGEAPDWLELFNASEAPIDLEGWYLTDSESELTRWRFPALTIASGEYQVIFASGKDRAVSGEPLHTNFRLSADREYLGLIEPDGETVHHAYTGEYPPQFTDISFGLLQGETTLLPWGSPVGYHVASPGEDISGLDWTLAEFDDTTWDEGAGDATMSVGYFVSPEPFAYGEGFSEPTDDLPADYPGWDYLSTGEGTAFVADGLLHLSLPSGGENSRAVYSDTPPGGFTLAGRVGVDGTSGSGGFNVGLVIGDLTAVFHPGYTGGAFRFGTINDGTLTPNEDMGWTPAVGVLHPMELAVTPIGDEWQVDVVITNATDLDQVFSSTVRIDSATLGVDADGVPVIGFSRNGGGGADGLFDDLSVNGGSAVELLATDLKEAMYEVSATVLLRQAFEIPPGGTSGFRRLTLDLRYDDGYVLLLDGIEITRKNASASLDAAIGASEAQPDPDSPSEISIDLSSHLGRLEAGTGVLALYALNAGAGDSDLFFDTEIRATHLISGETAYFLEPTPGTQNGAGIPGFIEDIVATSREPGTFDEPFDLTLQTDLPGGRVVYTTGGELPDEHAAAWEGSLFIDETQLLRARVISADGAYGPTRDFAYVRLGEELVDFDSPLPIVLLENFGAGSIPNKGWSSDGFGVVQVARQPAHVMIFERETDRAPLLGPATLDTRAGLRVRGAFSSSFSQPNYSLETWDALNEDADIAPFGMAPEADWVLYFPNTTYDQTMLYNTWTYALSNEIGHWAVQTRFAEAFVHEEGGALTMDHHAGLLVWMEAVERGSDRLDFESLSGDGTTGGWLLGINRVDAEPIGGGTPQSFHTRGPNRLVESTPNAYGGGDDIPVQWNGFINFDDPGGYDITTPQREAIEGWFIEMEEALYGPDWRDPDTGYRAYIDAADFIDYFIIHDLTQNGDGLLISMWVYLSAQDDLLRMGPVWDYDLAFWGSPESNLRLNDDRLWYGQMFDDPVFEQEYRDRWFELRAGALSDEQLTALIDTQADEITDEVAERHGLSDWRPRLQVMKSFVTSRARALDDYMD